MIQAFCFLIRHGGKSPYVIIASMLLIGCMRTEVGVPKVEPEIANYHITVVATREANINAEGKPVPLKINVFNLRSDTGFMNADFFALHNRPTEVLGNNLLSSEQLFLLPGGEAVNISGEKNGERYYVGITGEFQNLNNKTWRIIIPIPTPEKPPFYKFWRSSQPQQEIKVIANGQGLRVAENSNK